MLVPRIAMSTPRIAMSTPRFVMSTPRIVISTPRITMSTPRVVMSTSRITMPTPRITMSTPRIAIFTPRTLFTYDNDRYTNAQASLTNIFLSSVVAGVVFPGPPRIVLPSIIYYSTRKRRLTPTYSHRGRNGTTNVHNLLEDP